MPAAAALYISPVITPVRTPSDSSSLPNHRGIALITSGGSSSAPSLKGASDGGQTPVDRRGCISLREHRSLEVLDVGFSKVDYTKVAEGRADVHSDPLANVNKRRQLTLFVVGLQ